MKQQLSGGISWASRCLVKLLCPHIKVPLVGECDKRRCLHAFQRLDAAYCRGEPFVSYLFALEFIFRMIGRSHAHGRVCASRSRVTRHSRCCG